MVSQDATDATRGALVIAPPRVDNVHSPGRARGNVTMAHDPNFAKAFACAAGDKMVAAPVCKIG